MIAICFISLNRRWTGRLRANGAAVPSTTSQVAPATSVQFHILVVNRVIVDATIWRCNPRRHLAAVKYALHQTMHKASISLVRQPIGLMRVEFCPTDRPPGRISRYTRPATNIAPETRAGQRQTRSVSRLLNQSIPTFHTNVAVPDIRIACDFVHGIAHWNLLSLYAAIVVGHLEGVCLT